MTAPFTIAPRWPDRFLAVGRFLLFAGLFVGGLMAFGRSVAALHLPIHGFVWQALEGNLEVLATAIIVTAMLARLERRPFLGFGLGGDRQAHFVIFGLITGASLISLLLLALDLCGCFLFGVRDATALEMAGNGCAYLLLFGVVALAEETLWRGHALVNLARAISFWPAVIVISALFGLSHAHHGAENYLGLLFAVIYSVVLGYSFFRFGSLWFAISLHASWDYCQSFVFGVPDSGVIVPGSFLNASVSGPRWLSGGSAGPEGSLLMPLVFALLTWLIRRGGVAKNDSNSLPGNRFCPE